MLPLYLPFAFMYDGSLVERSTGAVIDHTYLHARARLETSKPAPHAGSSNKHDPHVHPIAALDWSLPDAVRNLDRHDPRPPAERRVAWRDPLRKNAAWIERFQRYVAANDSGLAALLGASWSDVVPIGAIQADSHATRRLFYWSTRFFVAQAAEW